MMAAIDRIKVEEYEFLLEYKRSKKEQVEFPYIVWVFKNGKPFMENTRLEQFRLYLPAEFSRSFLIDCCKTFVSNENAKIYPHTNPA